MKNRSNAPYDCKIWYVFGNIYAGLWYPMIVARITLVVVSLLLKETGHVRIWDEAGVRDAGATLTKDSHKTVTGAVR